MIITNKIKLPKLNKAQQEIIYGANRFNVLCCGRRFGKNIVLEDVITRTILDGKRVAYIEPTFRGSNEMWRDLTRILSPITVGSNATERRIECNTKGYVEFWSLEAFNAIRGKKYNLVVINEAAFSIYLQQAWEEVIRATLADYKGDAWFASTPQGLNFFKTLYDNADKHLAWSSFHYTSYDNPKIDPTEFDDARELLPEIVFRQEYMAEFVSGAGTLVSLTNLKHFNIEDIELSKLDIVMAVDLAISTKEKADYTAIAVLGRDNDSGNIYILDVIRERISFASMIDVVEATAQKWNAEIVGVENVAYQAAAVQELIRQTNLNIRSINPSKDKVTRFQAIAARYEHGLVYHNNSLINEFEKELLSFPLGEHDDMCDAVAYAYSLFSQSREASFIIFQ